MSELQFPLQFLRQYDAPLDVDMVFDTTAEMTTYLTNARRYAGQVVTCKEQEGKVLVLNNDKDEWLEVSGGGDLSEYSKLAIPITRAQAKTLSDSSALIPSQWYLITDYETKDYVIGSSYIGTQQLYTGATEQIYIKASSSTKIEPQGISKTYPDEIIEFNASEYNLILNKYTAFDTDSGSINVSGYYTLYIYDATTLTFDSTAEDLSDKINDYEIEITDNDEGSYYFYNSIDQIGKAWTWDNINLRLQLNNFTPFYMEYDDGTNYGDETLTVLSNNSFSLTNLTTEPYTCSVYGQSINVNNYDTGMSYSYIWADYGVTWEISSSGVITLLNAAEVGIYLDDDACYIYWEWGTTDLQPSTKIDFENNQCEGVFSFNLIEETVCGKIVARNNVLKKLYVQEDYRGTKHRRAKVKVNDWVSGSYTKGTYVRYDGYIWLCVESNSYVVPTTASIYWAQLFLDDYVMPNDCDFFNCSLPVNNLDYEDYFMFNLESLDATDKIINTKIYANENNYCNVVFSPWIQIENIKNCTIRVSGTTYQGLTFLVGPVENLNLSGYSSIFNVISDSNVNNITHSFLDKYQRNSIGLQIKYSLVNGLTDSEITYLSTSLIRFKTSANSSNKLFYVSGLDARAAFYNNNVIKMIGINRLQNNFFNNKITYFYFTNNFQNEVRNTTFNAEVYNLTCTALIRDSLFFGNVYNSTLSYVYGSTFFNNIGLTNITNGMNIINSVFLSSFSNNTFSGSESNSRITDCTFFSAVTQNNDKGKGIWLENSTFFGQVSHITNDGNFKSVIRDCVFNSSLGGVAKGIKLNKYGTGIQYIDGCFFNGSVSLLELMQGDLKDSRFEDCNFLKLGTSSYSATIEKCIFGVGAFGDGTLGYSEFGTTATTIFKGNQCGINFKKNAINGTYENNIFPNDYSSQTLSTGFSNIDLYNAQSFLKTTLTSFSSYELPAKSTYFFLDAASASVTARLPRAIGSGKILSFYAFDLSNTAKIDADGNGAEINGNTDYTFENVGDCVTVIDYAANDWRIVSHYHEVTTPSGITTTLTVYDIKDEIPYELTFTDGILTDKRSV